MTVSRKTVLITKNELTNAKLQEIFRHAKIEANLAADNLLITIDGLNITARSHADHGYIYLGCAYVPKPGTTSRQVLELSNRINEGLAFIKTYFSEGFFKLMVADYIDTNAGVAAEEVVDEARRFRAALRSAMAMDTEDILEARLRSYVQRCLEPEFEEGEEPRDWQSDPSFRSILDPLNAGDLTTAAQQAEKFAAQFPDLDLPYYWWAGALLPQRKLDEARKVCRRGLERSKRKYTLCARLGEVNWRADLLADAVYWWAQAVHCQESLRHPTDEYDPYLYLHYVAAGAGQPDVAAAFLRRSDSIRAGMIRLNSATAQSLTGLASRQTTPDIREVLTRLRTRYLQPEAPADQTEHEALPAQQVPAHAASPPEAPPSSPEVGLSQNGAELRDLFRAFATTPTQQIIDRVTALVMDSDDPDVTTAILGAFDINTTNWGVFGLALQSLGFVRDPRALEFLIDMFDKQKLRSQSEPNPQLRTIVTDHYMRTATSIVNLVTNKRDLDPKAIPYLKTIWDSSEFSSAGIQINALIALENLVPVVDDPELSEYVQEKMRSLV